MVSDNQKNLIAWSVIGTGLFIVVILLLVPDKPLRDSLIAAGVGSGLIAVFVGYVLLRIQAVGDNEANRSKASSFYHTKLKLDLRDALDQEGVTFSLGQGSKFYFGSMCNAVFDVLEENFESLTEYLAYFPGDVAGKKLLEFYILYRQLRTLGEKIDARLTQIVRKHHYENGIDPVNDGNTMNYVKARIATDVEEGELLQHLHWTTVPPRANEALVLIEADQDTLSLMTQLKTERSQLNLFIAELPGLMNS